MSSFKFSVTSVTRWRKSNSELGLSEDSQNYATRLPIFIRDFSVMESPLSSILAVVFDANYDEDDSWSCVFIDSYFWPFWFRKPSIILQSSAEEILLKGFGSSTFFNKSFMPSDRVIPSGTTYLPLIWSSFSLGLNGDLNVNRVKMMQPRAQISTRSPIGYSENRSIYSGARYNSEVTASMSYSICWRLSKVTSFICRCVLEPKSQIFHCFDELRSIFSI